MLRILLWLKKIETNHEAPKFKFDDRIRITKYKNIVSKGYTKNCWGEIFATDSVLKTNPRIEYIINELLSRTRQSY